MNIDCQKLFPLDEELYQENLKFFEENYPVIFSKLNKLQNIRGQLFIPEDSPDGLNLAVGKDQYFAKDVWEISREYIENWDDKYAPIYCPHMPPGRTMYFKENNETELDDLGHRILHKINTPVTEYLDSKDFDYKKATVQRQQSAHVVVIGLSLGALIHRLVHETEVKIIYILEESFEMLHHTMYVVNFPELDKKMAERGGKILPTIQKTPSWWVGALTAEIRSRLFTFNQCGRLYVTDHNVVDSEGLDYLHQEFTTLLHSKGFYEDQLIMLRNFCNNVYRAKYPIFMPKIRRKAEIPCFVVANGQSLNNNIDLIRKYQDKVLIISCGTALSTLLSYDLRPDIHVELENGKLTADIMKRLDELYGLKGITLVATSTLHKDTSQYFDNVLIYHRGGMTRFIHPAQYIGIRPHTEPTVANLGLSVSSYLGFSEVYLMGMDFGTTDLSLKRWHAKNSIHEDPEVFEEAREGKDAVLENTTFLKKSFQANFGGVGKTGMVLDLSMSRAEYAITQFHKSTDCTYFNTSDGLYLRGAIPKLPETVEINVPDDAKAHFLANFADSAFEIDQIKEPGSHLDEILNPDKIRQSFETFRSIITDYREPVHEDTIFPLLKLFARFEEVFERSEKPTNDKVSLDHHGYCISGSFYIWSQMYVATDAHMPKDLRTGFANAWLEGLWNSLDELEAGLLRLSEEFNDVRLERLEADRVKQESHMLVDENDG